MSGTFMRERSAPGKAARRDAASPESLLPPSDLETVGFGATVVVLDETAAAARTYTIVADAEADIPAGKIGLGSPLAQALLGARVGDVVVWKRPKGEVLLQVQTVAYE